MTGLSNTSSSSSKWKDPRRLPTLLCLLVSLWREEEQGEGEGRVDSDWEIKRQGWKGKQFTEMKHKGFGYHG